MEHRESTFLGKKKLKIYYQTWLPPKKSIKAVVVIAHGLGEHGGRYAHVAEALVGIDCAVYAVDHRGHGKSPGGGSAFVDRFSNVVEDMDHLIDLAKREHAKKPLFLLGHSMGGALALSYTLKHADKLTGLILSGPAVALDGAPPMMKPIAKVLSALAPKLGMFAVDPSLVSRDQDAVAAYASDPLNAHGKVPARTLGEIVKFVEWLPAVLPVITLPLLILHGSADKLAGVSGSKMVAERVSSKDKTLKIYQGLEHEIFNELPADRAIVLKDLTDWVGARI